MTNKPGEDRYCFVFNDQLPTNYHVVSSIMELAPGGTPKKESQIRKKVINAYREKLIDLWHKAFTEKHVQSRKTVSKKIRKLLENYFNEVTLSKKPKAGTPSLSKRQRLIKWREKSHILFDIKNIDSDPNDVFCFGEKEAEFYYDQSSYSKRLMFISDQVDEEYEEEEMVKMKEMAKVDEELSFIFDVEDSEETILNSTIRLNDAVANNRSGLARVATVDFGMQWDTPIDRPRIRTAARNFTNEIKTVCTELSVTCNFSTQVARKAVKIVCKRLYGHEYYLTKEEAIEKDESLQLLLKDQEEPIKPQPKPPKRLKVSTDHSVKRPHSAIDYKVYEFVLPVCKVLNDHKHVLAIHHEKDAAIALNGIQNGIKVTLHYDSTSRSQIDGDWPCLIFIFSNKVRFSLRPLFFAYEDRAQIIRLIVETFKRLAATINTIDYPISPKILWEKTTATMTDSVSKNHHIGDGVAEVLESNHIPISLLCKSHPVEAFDRSNLSVLAGIEKELDFRKKLERINPGVKSFLRGVTTVAECSLKSILSLVSHDKSANSTNQADLFDHIIEREGQVKHIAMYYERRFTKLGYSAASIIQSLPYLRMLLNETHLSNQHVEIVRMFLDSEFLITELKVLSYFTHAITLPFLYFVEVSSQEELLNMFPLLFNDLKSGKMDTLKDYVVEYPHVKVNKPSTDLEFQILDKMCVNAAEVFCTQAGREYGFGDQSKKPVRATQLHLLTKEELEYLPTNNLDAERNLCVFGKRAPVAKFRNKKFTAKAIRNDCTLYQSQTFSCTPTRGFNSIVMLLNDMEKEWVGEQKQLQVMKILEKIEKGKKQSKYTLKCLQLCKSWNGPATSVEELNSILKANGDNMEKIVRIELSYYRDTHKADVLYQPELFRINNISHDDQLLNLCALLSGNDPMAGYVTLPSNSDAAKVILSSGVSNDKDDDVQVGRNYVTLISEGDIDTWYIATCVNINEDDTFKMDFLHRVNRNENLKWKHPEKDDIDDLHPRSIVSCVVDGDWDVSKKRNITFTLRNHNYISQWINEYLN